MLAWRSMLVLDSFRGHCTDAVKARLADHRTELVIIPGGMTSMLQPLDMCLNKPLKAHMKRLYAEWMADGPYALTPTGHVRRPDVALLCQWIVDAWGAIPTDMVRKSFKKCAISNCLDGIEDYCVFETGDEASDGSSDSGESGDD